MSDEHNVYVRHDGSVVVRRNAEKVYDSRPERPKDPMRPGAVVRAEHPGKCTASAALPIVRGYHGWQCSNCGRICNWSELKDIVILAPGV